MWSLIFPSYHWMHCSKDQYTKLCKVFVDFIMSIDCKMCFSIQKAKVELTIHVIFNQKYDVDLELSHRQKDFFC